uniref:Secreted protein n=1 Tax=Hymenolepis diminuta TaxID=6216 RepID=A0A0R3SFN0_HYMDI
LMGRAPPTSVHSQPILTLSYGTFSPVFASVTVACISMSSPARIRKSSSPPTFDTLTLISGLSGITGSPTLSPLG